MAWYICHSSSFGLEAALINLKASFKQCCNWHGEDDESTVFERKEMT